jgi:hypothetical protein
VTAPLLPGTDPLARTVGYLTGQLSPVQREALLALDGRSDRAARRISPTYDVLVDMGLIERTTAHAGYVTELGHAVLRRLQP